MGKWKLGKLFGIDVYLHWSFLILIAWLVLPALLGSAPLLGVLSTLALVTGVFACVVLHELGHALAARRYGVGTHNIILYPIGGVANLNRIPRDPKQELVIALAGPAVNVVIAAVLAVILLVSGGMFAFNLNPLANSWLLNLLAINVVMVIFNMLPAFPMDGGRVLRAVAAMNTDYVSATRLAATIGKMMAIVFGLYAVFSGAWTLLLIAFFVYFAGEQERRMVEASERPQWQYHSVRYTTPPDSHHGSTGSGAITPEIVFHPSDNFRSRRW